MMVPHAGQRTTVVISREKEMCEMSSMSGHTSAQDRRKPLPSFWLSFFRELWYSTGGVGLG